MKDQHKYDPEPGWQWKWIIALIIFSFCAYTLLREFGGT